VNVRIHPQAAAEAYEGVNYYTDRAGNTLGSAFIAEFERIIAVLLLNPELGAQGKWSTRRLPMRRFPYNVVYRLSSGNLEILAVAHQRRKPGYWRVRVV
jgi:toxin ParE1/3/4